MEASLMKGENEPAVIDEFDGGESASDCSPVSERIPGAFTLIPDGVSCDFGREIVGGSRCDWDKGIFCGELESKARHGASLFRGSVLRGVLSYVKFSVENSVCDVHRGVPVCSS